MAAGRVTSFVCQRALRFSQESSSNRSLLGHRDQNMLLTHYRDLMKPTVAARYWMILPPTAIKNIVPLAERREADGVTT